MIAQKLLPITAVLLLPWLTTAEANAADQMLVYSNTVYLEQGDSLELAFDKVSGNSYEICVFPFSGDADVYTDWISWASPTNYEFSSSNSGTDTDCVYFDAPFAEFYYYSIYGYTATEFVFYVYQY
jgi:hypothetical protein